MSFKLQRRDSEEPSNEKQADTGDKKDNKPQKTYSVTVYVCLLFAVVIVIILMSYFVQQRNNSQALSSLREQHDQVTSQAFENIEKLQDTNMELLKENNDLKEKEKTSESKIEQLEKDAEDAEKQLESVKKENEYFKDLIALQNALSAKDSAAAKTAYEKLNADANSLPKEIKESLEALQTEYEKLIKD